MPERLQVDREAVRTLVVAVGVREAARQMGLAEGTVQYWSMKGRWTEKRQAAEQIARERIAKRPENATNAIQPSSTNSLQPADSLAQTLQDCNQRTRIGLSRAATKAAEHLQKQAPQKILNQSKALVNITTAASKLHGWEESKAQGIALNLGIAVQVME